MGFLTAASATASNLPANGQGSVGDAVFYNAVSALNRDLAAQEVGINRDIDARLAPLITAYEENPTAETRAQILALERARRDQLNEANAAYSESLEALKAQAPITARDLDIAESTLSTAQASANALQDDLRINSNMTSQTARALDRATRDLNSAQTDLNEAQRVVAAEIAAGRTPTAAMTANVTAAQNRVSALEADITANNEAIARLGTERAVMNENLRVANENVSTAREAQSVTERTRDEVDRRINNFVRDTNRDGIRALERINREASNEAARAIRVSDRAMRASDNETVLYERASDVRSSLGANGCGIDTLGGMICNFVVNTQGGQFLISSFAYLMGLLCGFLGIIKLKEHVETPNQVHLADPLKRFLAGGAFFALPTVVEAVRRTLSPTVFSTTNSGFNGEANGEGLDGMITRLMADILAPSLWAIGWVAWIAGLVLVFIGISRLMKTEEQGPRGPSGIGTIMTFIVAGCLLSLNSVLAYFNGTLFDVSTLQTSGVLAYQDGLGESAARAHAVISAVIAFSILLGWVSVVRGLFIVRDVSEGNSQASMMAAVTHLIGGALAVNLGGVINAVQSTLNITSYGITFN